MKVPPCFVCGLLQPFPFNSSLPLTDEGEGPNGSQIWPNLGSECFGQHYREVRELRHGGLSAVHELRVRSSYFEKRAAGTAGAWL